MRLILSIETKTPTMPSEGFVFQTGFTRMIALFGFLPEVVPQRETSPLDPCASINYGHCAGLPGITQRDLGDPTFGRRTIGLRWQVCTF